MVKELEHIFNSTSELRQCLSNVLPSEAVQYIVRLILKDEARKKYLKLGTEELENQS